MDTSNLEAGAACNNATGFSDYRYWITLKHMLWKRDKSIVPVLMFHSIGIVNLPWVWSTLSENLATFEQVLAKLSQKGFRTVGLADLYGHMAGVRRLPGNSVVLTFDDGYLDNWLTVAPLLRKYGMCATVYVTPEFVDKCSGLRSNTAVEGFMNWDELRAVDNEGILDVQCHALTHTWYFAGPKIVEIHRPMDVTPYPWLLWNARPERKPYYLNENQQEFVPWGQPVFEHEKSLIVRRFTPDTQRVNEILEYVEDNGSAEFFEHKDWQEKLKSQFPVLHASGKFPGTFESEDEYRDRILGELTESRQTIERELDKAVEFLAWPGGGVNETVVELAKQAGFKSWTLSSWQKPNFRNQQGSNAHEIKRVSGRNKVFWRKRLLKVGGSSWVMLKVLTHQGSLPSKLIGVCKRFAWIVASYLKTRTDTTEPKNGWH